MKKISFIILILLLPILLGIYAFSPVPYPAGSTRNRSRIVVFCETRKFQLARYSDEYNRPMSDFHHTVLVENLSETEFLAQQGNDGKWEIRDFRECRFAAPAGETTVTQSNHEIISTRSAQNEEELQGTECLMDISSSRTRDQFLREVGSKKPWGPNSLLEDYPITESFSFYQDFCAQNCQKRSRWRVALMDRVTYDDYIRWLSRAERIGEAEKIVFLEGENRTLTLLYDDKPRDMNVAPYGLYVQIQRKSSGEFQNIVYGCVDKSERDLAAHRIVVTFSHKDATGIQSDVSKTTQVQ
jgi:hypothetical protein